MTHRTLFATDLPLIQAPMAGVQDWRLAAAISNAGALGSLPAGMLNAAALEEQLTALAGATDRPWNVNFFCHTPPAPDPQGEQRWVETLRPYYDTFNADVAAIASGPSRQPFDGDCATVLARFRPAVVSFHYGLPDKALLDQVKATGARVLSSATTVDEALWLQAHGADGIIAQGLEAGGHRGHFLSDDLTLQQGTLTLLPQLVDAVSLPVIAAGGISTPAAVRAAMALGASAVQPGTAYLLCPEATTKTVHRQWLQSEQARHTALTTVFSGRPARGIVNRLMQELGYLPEQAPAFPLAGNAIGPLRAAAEARGSGDCSPLWAGQCASTCRAAPAQEITAWLASGL
ncbi:2-nitropropane dioxygenase [Alcanivorax hongdengensis A-11-3]|uniref:Nitronate monooxygenase n=1 Tax=Alcanivorax hongdengensis A-11-3 TaxID=1177179 RepID=L0W8W6_9GAMM|nr:nitronate monooxygenase [Alcanivorax hongdengensis]EKF73178.1 2-nitropropane dioxygenase [Alcanivorax hongdengensis A-11-3]